MDAEDLSQLSRAELEELVRQLRAQISEMKSARTYNEAPLLLSDPLSYLHSARDIDDVPTTLSFDLHDFDDAPMPRVIIDEPLVASSSSSQPHEYTCQVPGCTSKTKFKRKTDLQRHHHSLHNNYKIDCEYSWCGRTGENGFVRKDHYLEHLREMHRRDIPKNPRRTRK